MFIYNGTVSGMRRQAGTRQGEGNDIEDQQEGDDSKEEEAAENDSEPDYEAIEVHAIM